MMQNGQPSNGAVLPPVGAREPVASVLAEWNGRRPDRTHATYGSPFKPLATTHGSTCGTFCDTAGSPLYMRRL